MSRRTHATAACLLAVAVGSGLPYAASPPDATTQATTPTTVFVPPVLFEANAGQSDPRVNFLVRHPGYALFLTANDLVFSVGDASPARGIAALRRVPGGAGKRTKAEAGKQSVVHMTLAGAQWGDKPRGEQQSRAVLRDVQGGRKNPALKIQAFDRVKYPKVYPGVDLLLYSAGGKLRYDFEIAAGADESAIRLEFAGAKSVAVDGTGNLVIETAAGRMIHSAPKAYQNVSGARKNLRSRWVTRGARGAAVEVSGRARSAPLVIDPEIVFSTYLGGSGSDIVGSGWTNVAVDASGHAFVAGTTNSTQFPGTTTAISGTSDAYVVRYSMNGTTPQVDYATYLGGTLSDEAGSIAATPDGDVYIAGTSMSADFPATGGRFRGAVVGTQYKGFVARLDQSGAVAAAMYLGDGTGTGASSGTWLTGIALDPTGSSSTPAGVHVTGGSGDSGLATPGAFQTAMRGPSDAIVAKLDRHLSTLNYVSYIGGNKDEVALGIAVDHGRAYIGGRTYSRNFPVTPNAVQPAPTYAPQEAQDCIMDVPLASHCENGFVAVFDPSGAQRLFATYVSAGSNGQVMGITLDPQSRMLVTGFLKDASGNARVVARRLNAQGTAYDYTAQVSAPIWGTAIRADEFGRAYVTGFVGASNVATSDAAQRTFGGAADAFLAVVNPSGALAHFTYIGGSAADWGMDLALGRNDSIFVTGITNNSNAAGDFPIVNATQSQPGGGNDAFLTVFTQLNPSGLTVTKTASADQIFNGQQVTFTITVSNNGVAPATAVAIGDELPGGLAVQSAAPSECQTSSAANSVRCPEIVVAAGAQATVTVTAVGTGSGNACNHARVTYRESATPIDVYKCVTVLPPPPQLTVLKAGPATVGRAADVIYDVSVRNIGTVTARNVVLDDLVDDEKIVALMLATPSSGSCSVISGAHVRCLLGDLLPNAASTVQIRGRSDLVGVVRNTATATEASGFVQASFSFTTTVSGVTTDLILNALPPVTEGNFRRFEIDMTQADPSIAVGELTVDAAFDVPAADRAMNGTTATVVANAGSCSIISSAAGSTAPRVFSCSLTPRAGLQPPYVWAINIAVPSTINVSRLRARVSGQVNDPNPSNNCSSLQLTGGTYTRGTDCPP